MIDNAAQAAEKAAGGPWPENHCYTLNSVAAIVVPNADQKEFLIDVLQKALEQEFIDAEQFAEAVDKIKTYDELA